MLNQLKISILTTSLFGLFYLPVTSQIVVENDQTVEYYVQNVLMGEGVVASNITYNGAPANTVQPRIGYVNAIDSDFYFPESFSLNTRNAQISVCGPETDESGQGNDPDLSQLVTGNLYSVTVVEFDFIPQGDSLTFEYVFASREYHDFVCSQYNDIFGFFISGPGFNGPFSNNAVNIAQLPNGEAITVNNVNNGDYDFFTGEGGLPCTYDGVTCPCNTEYFTDNGGNQGDGTHSELCQGGYTVPLIAYAPVECGETYHIKLAISNVIDDGLQSSVYLNSASFQSNLVIDAALDIPVGVNDSTLYDGCGQAFLTFTRPGDTTIVETIYLEYTGDAENGVHYSQLPDSIVFEVNQSSATFPLTVPPGADITGPLQAFVTITNIASECSGDVLTSEFDFWVNAVDPLQVDFPDFAVDDCGEEITIAPIPTDGYGIYTYDWSTGDNTPEITVNPAVTTTYTVTVGDTCGMEPITGDITVDVPVYPEVEVEAGDDVTINTCLETAELEGEISGGNGIYSFEWYNGTELIGETQDLDYSPPGGVSTIYFVGSDACNNTATDSLTINVPPVDIFVDAGPDLVLEHCFDSVQVEATVEGGVPGEIEYNWYSATTGGLAVGPENSIWYNTPVEAYIVVEATDVCGNQAIDSAYVTVTPLEVIVDAGPDQSVESCHTFVDLTGTATGGYGDYTTVWTENDSLILGNAFDLNINPNGTSTYKLTATDECGNEGEDEVTVFYAIPELVVEMNEDTVVCNGGFANLSATVSGGVPPYDYQWNTSTINGPEITVQTYDTQSYSVQITDECDGNISGTTYVIVSHVNAVFDIFYGDFYDIELNNRSTPGDYYWEFGDGFSSTETDPLHSYGDALEYEVTLEVTDSLGCQDTFSAISIPEGEVYIPTGFTPNEDGINDLFDIKGFNIEKYELTIMNRYGEVVFKSTSLDDKWNGSVPGTSFYAESEVFVYKLFAETTKEKIIEKEGTITVIR